MIVDDTDSDHMSKLIHSRFQIHQLAWSLEARFPTSCVQLHNIQTVDPMSTSLGYCSLTEFD